ncbi:MAG TPA: hypothetical protein VKF62_06960, partial [Planctomycetota bacterium]|nr:hypothetical protein [Planctomycetota bacterium]
MARTRFGLLASIVLSGLAADARGQQDVARKEFDKRREETVLRAGQRHLEYGVELRKRGLTTQAAEQILLAVEASEGRNPGATTVLSLMRALDDKFWSKKAPKPTKAGIDAYTKEAAKLARQGRKERVDLALLAHTRGLGGEAGREVRGLLSSRDDPLEFDASGSLLLEGEKIPPEVSKPIREEAIEINGRLYGRDLFLSRLPALGRIFEKTSPELRVRSTRSAEEAETFHVLASALLPRLEADIGARPGRRLQLVLLGERKTYEAYLDAAHLEGHKTVDGLADREAFVALVCAHGLGEPTLQRVALHELTHLFERGCSSAVMPGWYMEGFAETYGGDGVFRWDGSRLETGGDFDRGRIEELQTNRFSLEEFLTADPLDLWGRDREGTLRFYAQSWAFLRYLRAGAGAEISDRLARWEAMCRGSAIGAVAGAPLKTDQAEAQALFLKTIAEKPEDLE